MRTLMREMWFRALMLLMYCLCVAAGAVSLNLYNFALEDGWYRANSEDFGFQNSILCERYISDCLYAVQRNLEWLEDPTNETLGGYGGRAFSYKITGCDGGAVTVDTTSDQSRYVSALDVTLYDEDNEVTVYTGDSETDTTTSRPR